jgi:hypothetical protein
MFTYVYIVKSKWKIKSNSVAFLVIMNFTVQNKNQQNSWHEVKLYDFI